MSPRNSSGTMAPANGPYVSGTTINSVAVNQRFADEETELTDSLSRSGKGAMLASLRAIDGTVAAPALSFTAEPASGVYRAAANDVRLAVGGVDALKLAAGGLGGNVKFAQAGDATVSTIATNAALTVQGNRAAGTVDADVFIASTVARTAGWIAAFLNGTSKLLVDYNGLLTLGAPATAIQPATIWTAITPNAGWTALQGLSYTKSAIGIVRLKGRVGGPGGNPAFTLPLGFRPAALRFYPSCDGAGVLTFVSVNTDGTVACVNSAGAAASASYVDCVSFMAEQ